MKPNERRIVECLNRPMKIGEIAAHTRLTQYQVHTALTLLLAEGSLIRKGRLYENPAHVGH